jgi:hypothetical protein
VSETTRWYVPAYRTTEGVVCALGTPTVLQEYAEGEAETIRRTEAGYADGDPLAIFVATRLEHPWEAPDDPR